jgi:serine/threonine protein kinase/Flp pilus assembly protein TadD
MNEREIFTAALHKSPEERAAFLDQVCQGDSQLRQQVEALLDEHAKLGSYLESPAVAAVATIDDRHTERPGTVIGPYKLLEQIGEGGMGTVWMAQQSEPVKRLVAIKLIKPGMDSRQVIARFEAERQALALMDHPDIAKVHDAGTTPDGRPYFVMELVKGVPITRYCDERRLTPRQRLELFVPVCQAIQHAHQKGIIHRDLKPSNVLVALYDDRPVPKVIDFGVAKATGQQLTEQTLHTGFGAVVGTVEYMSPEQAGFNQLDVDTRSDIYSLGVLLYELLTGSPPFTRKELERAGMLEMLRVIREQEPSKPSTKLSTAEGLPTLAANRGTEPAKLTKLVRGELDWIVMKALEKDRNRRYETANNFAMDLQRYLADEPVQACPPSAGYRFRKFARRNKAALSTAVMIGLAFLLAAGTLGWAVRDRATREEAAAREEATRQAATADKVEQALKDAAVLQQQAKWPEALEAVKRAEGFLAGGGNPDLAERVQEQRKDLEMILRLEQIRLPRAIGRAEGSYDNKSADAAYAEAFREYGIDVEALEPAEAAERIRPLTIRTELTIALDNWSDKRRSEKPADPSWKRLVAVARAADHDEWRNQVRDALEQNDRQSMTKLAVSAKISDLPLQSVSLLVSRGHLDKERELAILRQIQREHPDDYWINFQLAWSLQFATPPHQSFEEAVRFYTAALAVRPLNAPAHYFLGHALTQHGRLDEAISQFSKAIELKPDDAHAHNDLGTALRRTGKLEEAIAEFREAIRHKPNSALPHMNLGAALFDRRKVDEAIAEVREAIRLEPGNADAHTNLGHGLLEQGKWAEAIAACEEAIRIRKDDVRPRVLLAMLLSTCPDTKHRDAGRAIAVAKPAVELNQQSSITWQVLGWAQYRMGNWQASIQALEKSCQLERGTGDCGQWIVLALAHAQLARQADLSENERAQHQAEARRHYEASSKQIDTSDNPQYIMQAIRAFRREAAKLLGDQEKKQ